MASVIPKSKKKTLPRNLADSISLFILPNAFLPSSVSQSHTSESSDLLILWVPGISKSKLILLLLTLHLPELPSLKVNVTGTVASFTIVAQDERKNTDNKSKVICFI